MEMSQSPVFLGPGTPRSWLELWAEAWPSRWVVSPGGLGAFGKSKRQTGKQAGMQAGKMGDAAHRWQRT
ncbi:MAG: hypothetical protein ACOYKN_05195 [Pirellula sp.]|jgi:hypothetical protein